jgi:hypothetical protein
MPAFVFSPLEISRAAGLADETKRVIAAFEQCLASSDMGGLSALRAAIEVRRERRACSEQAPPPPPPRPLTALPICFSRMRSAASTSWTFSTTRTWLTSAPCSLGASRAAALEKVLTAR